MKYFDKVLKKIDEYKNIVKTDTLMKNNGRFFSEKIG
jgi:hypothetical protein